MSILVLTASYGDYDRLSEQPAQTVDATWVAVTDQPCAFETWSVLVEPRPNVGPRLAAKVPKACPHLYGDFDTYVWMDAAARFKDEHGLMTLLKWANGKRISQFCHHERQCIYDEAVVAQPIQKYRHEDLHAQVNHYRMLGMPYGFGLWPTGVIVYNGRPPFGEQWLAEQLRWTDQDQLSQPYLYWSVFGRGPNVMPGVIYDALDWDYDYRPGAGA